jgi:hypothetical protein
MPTFLLTFLLTSPDLIEARGGLAGEESKQRGSGRSEAIPRDTASCPRTT